MNQTYTTKAIILNTSPFRERDSRVLAYSSEHGLLSLVARGTSSQKSKLSPFIQPITYAHLLVAKGKAFDYLSSSSSLNSFLDLRDNYESVRSAGEVIKFFKKHTKAGEADQDLFNLLYDYLLFLENKTFKDDELGLFYYFFILKFLCQTGHKPELYHCVKTGKKIESNSPPAPLNYFDYENGGLSLKPSKNTLTISDNSIKILRLVLSKDFTVLSKINYLFFQKSELEKIIKLYYEYNFS